ncbi:MAG: lysine-sensitive aspartokinase 3 [Bacteriovoracaceae bacterium]
MKAYKVAKFGGSSMKDKLAMENSACVIGQSKADIVIVSATYGTTNQLVEITEAVTKGDWQVVEKIITEIKDRHLNLAEEVSLDDPRLEKLKNFLARLETLSKGCTLLKECSLKAYDGILSTGELLSSLIFSKVMEFHLNTEVQWFDSRDVIATDAEHSKARPNLEQTAKNCLQTFQSETAIYVGQGFIGRSKKGATTTLGRGGSDYSAALIAEGIKATELEIWTDVPGMASTDPRLCEKAKSIEKISFKEAAEMATFGAKILHPATLAPAMRSEIPVFVGSSQDLKAGGTTIVKTDEDSPSVRAVTVRHNQAILTLSNPRMLNAYGFLKAIFEIFDKYEVSVDAITTSEISVAMTVDKSIEEQTEFLDELRSLGKVHIETGLSLVALIGNRIPETSGTGYKIFESLLDINVRMICQGASHHNFCFLVESKNAELAVLRLHKAFLE